jgi:hypothetical protein
MNPLRTLKPGRIWISPVVPLADAIPVAFVVVEPVSLDAWSFGSVFRGVVVVGRVLAVVRRLSCKISCWLVSLVSWLISILRIAIPTVAGVESWANGTAVSDARAEIGRVYSPLAI